MNALKITLLLSAVVGVYVSNAFSTANSDKKIKFVASADGKSYFAELAPSRNWTNAGKYCESLGMSLATVTSARQAQALKGGFSTDFSGGYWIGARDSHTHSQFVWNATNQGISDEYIDLGNDGFEYQTCVYFWIGSSSSAYYLWHCAEGSGTLCETTS